VQEKYIYNGGGGEGEDRVIHPVDLGLKSNNYNISQAYTACQEYIIRSNLTKKRMLLVLAHAICFCMSVIRHCKPS
jgi:hypothetical protein